MGAPNQNKMKQNKKRKVLQKGEVEYLKEEGLLRGYDFDLIAKDKNNKCVAEFFEYLVEKSKNKNEKD